MRYKVHKSCQLKNAEVLYDDLFGQIETGVFVDIGAFDGFTGSNTAPLADAGWRGVLVEPMPKYAYFCHLYHRDAKTHAKCNDEPENPDFIPNDVLIWNCAVGPEWGIVQIQECMQMSSINTDFLDAALQMGVPEVEEYVNKWIGAKIKVPQMPLDEILWLSSVPKCFDVLNIDVEGYEWDVLATFNITNWDPRYVIIEMHEQCKEWQQFKFMQENTQLLNDYFKKARYTKIYSDDINNIYERGA